MTDQIISLDLIRAKARAAFNRGAGRDDHNFNWHSTAAIATWQEAYDQAALEWHSATRQQAEVVKVSPP